MQEPMIVSDAMRTIVITIHVSAFADEAARLLVEHGVNSLPVVETNGEVVGVVGIKDILRAPMPRHWWTVPMALSPALETWAAQLRATPIARIMATKLQTIDEAAPLGAAAARMANSGVHPLLVLRDGKLAGLISRADVLRHVLIGASEQLGAPARHEY